jgi:hypothetical protein
MRFEAWLLGFLALSEYAHGVLVHFDWLCVVVVDSAHAWASEHFSSCFDSSGVFDILDTGGTGFGFK